MHDSTNVETPNAAATAPSAPAPQQGTNTLPKRISRKVRNWLAINGYSPERLRQPIAGEPAFYSPQDAEDLQSMFTWAREYLSKPHPQLGRNGAVCPFVPKSLNENRFLITMRREVKGYDAAAVERLLLEHVHTFKAHHPANSNKDAFNSLLLVFPRVAPEHGHVVDEVHTRHKSSLMFSGIMLSQFHPLCDKPAIYNEGFKAYTSPFPCIVIRHMGIHDIAFLSHNRAGFAEYKRRFGNQYADGKVSNEHGYVDLFNAAVARFPG